MKILHVIPYADPSYGGPTVAVRRMAVAMREGRHDVHVATTNAAGIYDLQFTNQFVTIEKGISFHYFRRTFPRKWFYAPSMKQWLNDHAKNYDLLHLHIPFTAPFRYGALAARLAKRPYVVSSHGLLDSWSLKQKTWKKLPYLYLLEGKNLRSASAIHVTSPLEAKFLESMNYGSKVRCIPLAVNPILGSPSYSNLSNYYRILFIARLHPVKGLPILFESLKKLRAKNYNIFLDLAGDGDANYVRYLKKYAYNLGISDIIAWHGHIDEREKRELYSKANCFVLLSYHENFGLAVAEALAGGVPAVISDQVGLAPDVIANEAGKVVPAGDPEAAATAIESLFNSHLNMQYRANARRIAERCYSPEIFGERLSLLYASTIESYVYNK